MQGLDRFNPTRARGIMPPSPGWHKQLFALYHLTKLALVRSCAILTRQIFSGILYARRTLPRIAHASGGWDFMARAGSTAGLWCSSFPAPSSMPLTILCTAPRTLLNLQYPRSIQECTRAMLRHCDLRITDSLFRSTTP